MNARDTPRPIAVVSFGFGMGLEVLDIEYGVEDRIVYRYTGEARIRKARVYHGVRHDYIRTTAGRIGLEEMVRV